MKAIFLLIGILFTFSSQATTLTDFFQSSEIESVCAATLKTNTSGNSWRTFRPRFSYDGSNLYYAVRDSHGSFTVFKSSLGQTPKPLFSSSEAIVDIEAKNHSLWIANKEFIHHYDLLTDQLTFKIRTMPGDRKLTKHEVIHDIHLMQGVLYIAQGVRGIFALDANSRQILWNEYFNINQSGGHRSKVINIVGDNGTLFAGLDNITLPTNGSAPFNGFIQFAANNPRVFTQSPYDRQRAGIMAYAHTTIANDTIYINNMGHLQYIAINKLKDNKKIRPSWYPNWYRDVDLRRTAMWSGNVLVENNTAYGCAQFSYAQGLPRPVRVAKPLITKF